MAVIIVPALDGMVTNPVFNDTLQADPSVDIKSIPVFYEVNGNAVLQSLFIGYDLEADINGTLTGAGTITGATNPNVGNAGFIDNFGKLDINGTIAASFNNDGQITVSAGEKLDLESDFVSLLPSAITVAAGAELDVNSVTSAQVSAIDVEGTLVATSPSTQLLSGTVVNGSLVVHGDAQNGYGTGVLQPRANGNSTGAYTATLDLRQAPLTTPLPSLTLGADAAVQFGANAYTVKRLSATGVATAVAPLDTISVAGTLTVAGDRSGQTGQVSLAGALLTGKGTVDLAVAASDGGAVLQQQVTIDAGTTLRNDGAMTLGSAGGATSSISPVATNVGSQFINGIAGTISVARGALLQVAAFENDGKVEITMGTLSIGSTLTGSGTITVDSGAGLSIDTASAANNVVLSGAASLRIGSGAAFGGTLQLQSATGRIDLVGVSASGATVSNGAIAVATGAGTVSLKEAGLAAGLKLSVTSDGNGGSFIGFTAQNAAPAAVSDPAIYRFFDKVHGTHFFTASATESAGLQSTRSDLTYEGVGLFGVDQSTDSNAAPVYRFFDTKFGTHFYTSSLAEKNSVQSARADLTYEGVGFYEHAAQQPGDVAVYRYFDKNFGTHFYTSSASEQATIAATRSDLVNEGIGFYAPSA